MPTFTWTPDRGASKDTTTRVNSASFGDGYTQRVGDGLNNVKEMWSLSFTLRTKIEINAIDDFLIARKGYENFDWTNPRGVSKKYVCSRWSPTYNHDGDCSISMSFEEDFEA